MVLGATPVTRDPLELAAGLGLELGIRRAQALFGEQARLDALGEVDLLLGVQQGDLADLLEVVLDRVGRRTGGDDLLGRLVVVVGVGEDEAARLVGLFGLLRRGGRLVRVVALDLDLVGLVDVVGLAATALDGRSLGGGLARCTLGRGDRCGVVSRGGRAVSRSGGAAAGDDRLGCGLADRAGRDRCGLLGCGLLDGASGGARGAGRRRCGHRRGREVDVDPGGHESTEDSLETLGVTDLCLLAGIAEGLRVDTTVGRTTTEEFLESGVLEFTREGGIRRDGRHKRPFGISGSQSRLA